MDYEVQLAEAHHTAPLQAVERAASQLFPVEDLPKALRDEVTPMEEFREAQRDGRLWVACEPEDRVVGFGLVRFLAGAPHLQELSVDPRHGRRGVGKALVSAICSWARSMGHGAVTLTTFDHLPWNRPFYEGLGFRVLSAEALPTTLRDVLAEEIEEGLDGSKRVAMRYGFCEEQSDD